MSVFDRSYRKYDGELKGRLFKIWSIAKNSFRVQFHGKKVIFLLIFCNLPVLSFTLMLIFMAIFIPAGFADVFLGQMFGSLDIALYLIIIFSFNAGSIFMPLVFVAALNSGSIANDKKHNSLALYMARPIDRVDYVAGKGLSVLMINSFVTFVPWFIFMVAFSLLSGITGNQFTQTIWVYFAALAAALIIMIFLGSIVLFFSSITNQSILGGILTILILFLPSVITSSLSAIFTQASWLNYFSVSALFSSTIYVVFGKPSFASILGGDAGDAGLGFFGYNINGWVSMGILLTISVIMILLTIRNIYKEDIN